MPISSALGSSALLPAGLGFRNVLINGDFKIWQRGTSKAMATGFGTGYLADRWTGARSAYTAGGTVSRQTASLDGFQYCSRIQRDSGNTSTATFYYYQTLETVTSIPLANKPVVYSFYIRAGANFSGAVTARLYSGTATDQSNYPDTAITGQATVISSALTITTTWQRVILYGSVASSATQLFVGFDWTPSGTAGAADYFEVTGVQLEQNYQPTPFEQRPIGVELALCQRYYEKSYNIDVAPGTNTNVGIIYMYGGTDGGGYVGTNIKFCASKRSNGYTVKVWSLNGSSTTGWNWGNSSSSGVGTVSAAFASTNQVTVYVPTGVGWTAAYSYGHYAIENEL